MAKSKLIIIEIIFLFISIALAFAFIYDFSTNQIFNTYFLFRTILLSVFILIVALISALIISSLIKGHYVKEFFQNFLKWTIPLSLLLGFFILYDWHMENKYHYRQENLLHNENYKNFYQDSRDENIKMVINKIENQLDNKGDYKIITMRVVEKDTIINNTQSFYYDIHQIYYIGKEGYTNNVYFARHISADKKIEELNFNIPVSSPLISEHISTIDTLVKNMLTSQTLDSITENSKNFVWGLIKLKE